MATVTLPSDMSDAYKSILRAVDSYGDRQAGRWCRELTTHGLGDELHWGFQIYRTVYSPGSDEQFATAVEVLQAYLRDDCIGEYGLHGPLPDGPANNELLQRLKLDIVEDRELEDAAAPIIQQRFQAWVESHGLFIATSQAPDLSLEQASSSSHRFCIIIDAEAVQNELRFPVPVPRRSSDWDDHLGVKVLDV